MLIQILYTSSNKRFIGLRRWLAAPQHSSSKLGSAFGLHSHFVYRLEEDGGLLKEGGVRLSLRVLRACSYKTGAEDWRQGFVPILFKRLISVFVFPLDEVFTTTGTTSVTYKALGNHSLDGSLEDSTVQTRRRSHQDKVLSLPPVGQ